MDKITLIDSIRQINCSARPDWLSGFDAPALRLYLDHLRMTLEPRGRGHGWIRRGDTPAIVTRRPLL